MEGDQQETRGKTEDGEEEDEAGGRRQSRIEA
jgi:hypothetical protein